jgi:mRNA interferase MazF
MKRGELYRVYNPAGDKKAYRTFVIVSRQVLIDSRFSSLICAPVYTHGQALATQVAIGIDEGMKHSSFILCDNLTSLQKNELTSYVGSLGRAKLAELDRALKMALDLS